jgi:peptidoglycan/LPS O-acetylase OafA/YrhL
MLRMKAVNALRAGATKAAAAALGAARHITPGGLPTGRQGGADAQPAREEPRIVALDGLRGLMTIMVVVSHFFAEVPNGWHGLAFGWIAVTMFFVLSGYLVGRLILEKQDRANFFKVFYVRRVCRTLPVYFFCVTLVFVILKALPAAHWADADVMFPLWSYLTFTQNFFMVATDGIGAHWLAPTWTLTVEEHFYLIAPALFFLVPRRYLLPVFAAAALLTVVYRFAAFEMGLVSEMACLILLPGVASGLLFGLMAAVLMKTEGIDWARYDFTLRIGPLALILATGALKLVDGDTGQSFNVLSDTTVAAACALYIMAVVRGAPEGKRLESRVLCFFGNTSYSIYLTHLAVLGLMHGLLLGARPDVATATQIGVTVAALPLALLVGWAFTRLVEEPITRYGRSFKWSAARRERAGVPSPETAAA